MPGFGFWFDLDEFDDVLSKRKKYIIFDFILQFLNFLQSCQRVSVFDPERIRVIIYESLIVWHDGGRGFRVKC